MPIYLKIDSLAAELGESDFIHAFFSTVSARLEPDTGWGSRFPTLLLELYDGSLAKTHAAQAVSELQIIKRELSAFPPSAVVWDIEHPDRSPPWGDEIAGTITDLSNYFVTSTGCDLIETMEEVLVFFRDEGTEPNCRLLSESEL